MDQTYLKKIWQKGMNALENGDFTKAINYLKKVSKGQPDNLDVLLVLADALAADKQFDNSIRYYQILAKKNPDSLLVFNRLGGALLMGGYSEQASVAFNKSISIDPDNLQAIVGLAETSASRSNFKKSEEYFSRALTIAPDNSELIISLARMHDAQGLIDKAEDALRKGCRDFSTKPELWLALGNALKAWYRLEEAYAAFLKGSEVNPDSFDLYHALGNAAYQLRDLSSAKEIFNNLLKQYPKNPNLRNTQGQILASLGEEQNANFIFRKLTSDEPYYGEPWLNISRSKKYLNLDDPDILQMRTLIKKPQIDSTQSVFLHFALGKALDDCCDYRTAFGHLEQGNKIFRKTIQFDINSIEKDLNNLILNFTPDLVDSCINKGSQSVRPIFIVGMPRSGTTLTEQIICAHPDVGTAGELRDISQIARKIMSNIGQSWPDILREMPAEDVQNLANEYLNSIALKNLDSDRVIDKMPQNFLNLGLILLLFPKITVIHCHRNPMDTCLSTYFQIFPEGINFAYDFEEMGRYYNCYRKIMRHWEMLFGDRIFRLSYEDLVGSPEPTLRKLLDKLGLNWSSKCLSHHKVVQRVDTLSLYQVKQPLHKRSKHRWRNYEEFLTPLKEFIQLDS